MFNKCFKPCFAVVMLFTAMIGSIDAAPTYQLRFDQTDLSLLPGESTDVQIFLDETIDTGDSFILGSGSGLNGLITARFDIQQTGSGDSMISAAAPAMSMTGSVITGVGTPLVTFANAIGFDIADVPVVGFDNGPLTRSVFLGSVSLTAGSAGSTNLFQLADASAGDDFVIGDGLDGLISGDPNVFLDAGISFGSVSVTAVPEPSSAIAILIAVAGLVHYRRRTAAVGQPSTTT